MAARSLDNRRSGTLGHLALQRWRNHPVIGVNEIPARLAPPRGRRERRPGPVFGNVIRASYPSWLAEAAIAAIARRFAVEDRRCTGVAERPLPGSSRAVLTLLRRRSSCR